MSKPVVKPKKPRDPYLRETQNADRKFERLAKVLWAKGECLDAVSEAHKDARVQIRLRYNRANWNEWTPGAHSRSWDWAIKLGPSPVEVKPSGSVLPSEVFLSNLDSNVVPVHNEVAACRTVVTRKDEAAVEQDMVEEVRVEKVISQQPFLVAFSAPPAFLTKELVVDQPPEVNSAVLRAVPLPRKKAKLGYGTKETFDWRKKLQRDMLVEKRAPPLVLKKWDLLADKLFKTPDVVCVTLARGLLAHVQYLAWEFATGHVQPWGYLQSRHPLPMVCSVDTVLMLEISGWACRDITGEVQLSPAEFGLLQSSLAIRRGVLYGGDARNTLWRRVLVGEGTDDEQPQPVAGKVADISEHVAVLAACPSREESVGLNLPHRSVQRISLFKCGTQGCSKRRPKVRQVPYLTIDRSDPCGGTFSVLKEAVLSSLLRQGVPRKFTCTECQSGILFSPDLTQVHCPQLLVVATRTNFSIAYSESLKLGEVVHYELTGVALWCDDHYACTVQLPLEVGERYRTGWFSYDDFSPGRRRLKRVNSFRDYPAMAKEEGAYPRMWYFVRVDTGPGRMDLSKCDQRRPSVAPPKHYVSVE
jgi:hypothetical protein